MARWLCLGWALLLAACGLTDAAPPAQESVWGDVIVLAKAEQASAPALWVAPDRVTAAWIGADTDGVYQAARSLTRAGLSATARFPLARVHPYAQQLFPAGGGNLHLLWLDADTSNETRLFSALISPQLELLRGPTPVSDRWTLHYTAFVNGDGSLWVVFSGGLAAEPALFARYVDADGRVRQDMNRLAADAEWPSLAPAADRTAWLFWRQPSDGQVFRARFADGQLAASQPTVTISLNSGDRLDSLRAARDQTHAYLFWNVTRADGQAEASWASGTTDARVWLPARFGIRSDPQQAFITGFNTGTASAAQAGDNWLGQAVPLAAPVETLPVAARLGRALVIVYLRGGQIAGYQEILQNSQLIGLPALYADRDLFLYLAWAQPSATGAADLRLVSLKPN